MRHLIGSQVISEAGSTSLTQRRIESKSLTQKLESDQTRKQASACQSGCHGDKTFTISSWSQRASLVRYLTSGRFVSAAGGRYLRQFAPQVVSGGVAVHVTQQIILETNGEKGSIV